VFPQSREVIPRDSRVHELQNARHFVALVISDKTPCMHSFQIWPDIGFGGALRAGAGRRLARWAPSSQSSAMTPPSSSEPLCSPSRICSRKPDSADASTTLAGLSWGPGASKRLGNGREMMAGLNSSMVTCWPVKILLRGGSGSDNV